MQLNSRFFTNLFIGFAALVGLVAVGVPAQAAVRLVSFTLTPSQSQVLVKWETASEIGTSGFFIQRSLQPTSGFGRVSPFIPTSGDSLAGASYEYKDTAVVNGITYYYLLEVINTNLASEMYGPAAAVPGQEQQPTSTATPTATSTPTATQPAYTATPTPTRTNTPLLAATQTLTPTPAARTSTPGASGTARPTDTLATASANPATPGSASPMPAASAAAATQVSAAPPGATPLPGTAPTRAAAAPASTPAPAAESTLPFTTLLLGGTAALVVIGLVLWGGWNALKRGRPE